MVRDMHPSPEALRDFILGRLDARAMDRIERHVRGCDACVRAAQDVPGDRLVRLVGELRDEGRRRTPMGRRAWLILALGGVLDLAGAGCSGGSGPTLDPQKAKAAFRKRFANGDEKAAPAPGRRPRR